MKTFKTFLETVDKPKSPDEQAFVDKHIVSVSKHPVAGDDQFVSKNKKDKSKAASYKDGEDKDVYEAIKPELEKHFPASGVRKHAPYRNPGLEKLAQQRRQEKQKQN